VRAYVGLDWTPIDTAVVSSGSITKCRKASKGIAGGMVHASTPFRDFLFLLSALPFATMTSVYSRPLQQ
jgi:hypothetical protein